VEQVAEPSLEYVDLGLGHWHVLGPVIGHRPLDRIDLPRWPGAASGSTRIVVEIAESRGQWDQAPLPRFLGASHGASVAPDAIPQNARSPGGTRGWLGSRPASPRARCRPRKAMIAWRRDAGPPKPVKAASRRSRARAARALTGFGSPAAHRTKR